MDPNEFAAALKTVEQDHHLVLEKMRMLKDIAGHLFDSGEQDPHSIVAPLADINKYFATEFEAHMDEEEVTLFPLLENYKAGGADLVARLRKEHEELRRKRAELEGCLVIAAELEDTVPRAILRDLLLYGWEFWDVLDTHAHTETHALQQCIRNSLDTDVVPAQGKP